MKKFHKIDSSTLNHRYNLALKHLYNIFKTPLAQELKFSALSSGEIIYSEYNKFVDIDTDLILLTDCGCIGISKTSLTLYAENIKYQLPFKKVDFIISVLNDYDEDYDKIESGINLINIDGHTHEYRLPYVKSETTFRVANIYGFLLTFMKRGFLTLFESSDDQKINEIRELSFQSIKNVKFDSEGDYNSALYIDFYGHTTEEIIQETDSMLDGFCNFFFNSNLSAGLFGTIQDLYESAEPLLFIGPRSLIRQGAIIRINREWIERTDIFGEKNENYGKHIYPFKFESVVKFKLDTRTDKIIAQLSDSPFNNENYETHELIIHPDKKVNLLNAVLDYLRTDNTVNQQCLNYIS